MRLNPVFKGIVCCSLALPAAHIRVVEVRKNLFAGFQFAPLTAELHSKAGSAVYQHLALSFASLKRLDCRLSLA